MTRAGGRLAALGLAAAQVVAACLPGGEATLPAATPSGRPEPTPIVVRAQLATAVWYAGFRLDFSTAIATLDPKGGSVVVDVRYANLGPETASFSAPIRLVAGPASFEATRGTVFPEVPAGGTADAQVTFTVVGQLALDGASIQVGRAGDHLAVVPLTGGAGGATILEPSPIAATGRATAGGLRIAVTGGEIRADLPDWGAELPADSLLVALTFDATYVGDFAGGLPLTGANLALRLPDGTEVGVRRDGRSEAIALLLPRVAKRALTSRFEIPSPAGGTYALVVRVGSASAAIRFTVPAWP